MKDSRLQRAFDDITEALKHREASEACIDDARTALADILEEGPEDKLAAQIVRYIVEYLNDVINPFGIAKLVSAQSLIESVQRRGRDA